jgi:hypothetical protein
MGGLEESGSIMDPERSGCGASGRYDALKERAQTLTFLLARWGLAP